MSVLRSRYEVVIVGGGPAGISTALFLSHSRPELTDRIVVLEKERYPRDKYCAGGVGARADNLLGSIGVTLDVPSVWLRGVAFRAQGATRVVRDSDPGVIGRVVRRVEFDHELARTAAKRGIRVLEGVRVAGVDVRPDAVEVKSSAGPLLAQAVVAADGVASSVRKSLGIQATRYHAQALEIDTEPVDGDVERDLLMFDVSRRILPGYYWDFPTIVDNRELVCRGVYLLKTARAEPAVEIQDVLSAELRQRGLELGRYTKKRFAERGFELHSPLAGRRVVLVGEAAGIDPVTGEGIAQAIQYGAVAGRYLARKLVERDLEFGDWRAEVSSTMIGRDLIARTLGVGLFYGAYRPNVERFLLDTPDFVRVGLQHFAGKRWSRRALLNAAWGASRHGLRALIGSSSEPNGTAKPHGT